MHFFDGATRFLAADLTVGALSTWVQIEVISTSTFSCSHRSIAISDYTFFQVGYLTQFLFAFHLLKTGLELKPISFAVLTFHCSSLPLFFYTSRKHILIVFMSKPEFCIGGCHCADAAAP